VNMINWNFHPLTPNPSPKRGRAERLAKNRLVDSWQP
jgi:hypothetical protein